MHVHVGHAVAQTGLQHLRVPPEEPHDTGPAQTGKHRPGAFPDELQLPFIQAEDALAAVSAVRAADERVVARRLHGQLGQTQHHSREDVDADLLADAAESRLAMPENPVAAEQASEEGVHAVLLAVDALEREHGGLVEEGELGQVVRVQAGCLVDGPEFLTHRAGAEEEDHDQGVWEAHFDAVDEAISDGFEEDQRLMVLGV